MRPARALLLVVLLAATLLPQANAAIPTPASWSPWTAPQNVNAIALADEGRTIAAALAAYTGSSGCPPTQSGCTPVSDPSARYDLGVLTVDQGFVAPNFDNTDDLRPGGRTHVAVSADGSSIASIGLDASTSLSISVVVPKLYYARAAAGNNWTAAGPNQTAEIAGTPVGVAISHDGNRVVALTDNGGNISLRGYTFTNGVLLQAFHFFEPGRPQALATDRALSHILIASVEATGAVNRTTLRYTTFESVSSHTPYYGPDAANFTRVAMSDDGLRFAAGSTDGTVSFFRGIGAPETLTMGANVDRLAISGDGLRFAVGANTTLRAYDVGATLTEAYNRTTASPVRDLEFNRTGDVLAVAASDGVTALGATGAQFWKLAGDTSGVDLNANASAIAWTTRNLVFTSTLLRNFTLAQTGNVDTTPAKVIAPGESGTFALLVRNSGALPERIAFETPSDVGADITFEPATLLVDPEQTATVTATVTPRAQASGGRTFNVTARSVTSGLTDDTTLAYTIAQIADVRLFLNVSEVLAVPGQTSDLLLEVLNEGTKSVAASLRVQQSVSAGPEWSVVVEPVTSFTISPLSKTTLHLKVTPPEGAANGTSNTVTYVLEGTEVADEVRVVYRINPTLGVDLRASGAVKYIDAGQSDTFNVTVTNTGSLPRRFELYYDTNETSGKSWRIEVPEEPFILQPLQNRTFAIRVTVPTDARPPDRLMFMVTAALIPEGTEAVVKDYVHIYANAQEPPTPDEEDKTDDLIPSPPVPIAAAAVALAALLLRRRRA